MDDSGVADAFYTVLSIGIVLIAAIAVSGVVLSATMGQSEGAGSQVAGFSEGGMKEGVYCFYYAADGARSNGLSDDPDGIVLQRLASEKTSDAIDFSPAIAPPEAPKTMGAVLWSGYFYAPSAGAYTFELRSAGKAWVWVDGTMAANNSLSSGQVKAFTLHLTKGYHPLKARYFYPDISAASCSLYPKQESQTAPAKSFYR